MQKLLLSHIRRYVHFRENATKDRNQCIAWCARLLLLFDKLIGIKNGLTEAKETQQLT